MKAVFISYNQALTERVLSILDRNGARGFTKWGLTEGRGSVDGEPHYGSHAWPAMNSSILTVVEDDKAKAILEDLRQMDAETQMQGSRAFLWEITGQM